jgi:hypothetical protein
MTNVLRYRGLDLPEFPAEEVLYRKPQYKQAAAEDRPDFIRSLLTTGPEDSLRTRLDRASQTFQHISELCGVSVVPYEWGVYKDRPKNYSQDPAIELRRKLCSNILPQGYLLAARVATIKPASDKLPPDVVSAFSAGVAVYDQEVEASGRISESFADLSLEQLLYGYLIKDRASKTLQGWWVDIEPRMGTYVTNLPDGRAFTNARHVVQ